MLLEFGGSASFQKIIRGNRSFRDLVAVLHAVAFGNDDVFAHRDKVIDAFARFRIGDDDLLLATDVSTEGDIPFDFGDNTGFLRFAGFEKLGDSRKTTGDILGASDFSWSLRELRSSRDLLAFLDGKVGADRN